MFGFHQLCVDVPVPHILSNTKFYGMCLFFYNNNWVRGKCIISWHFLKGTEKTEVEQSNTNNLIANFFNRAEWFVAF